MLSIPLPPPPLAAACCHLLLANLRLPLLFGHAAGGRA